MCEGGEIRMIPEKIVMSRGGERLEDVIGRGEEEEMPNFENGAFEIAVGDRLRIGKKMVDNEFLDKYIQEGAVDKHTMRSLIDSIQLVDATDFACSKVSQCRFLVFRV